MAIVCTLFGHSATAKIIRNAGNSFSTCARCKANLVQIDGKWTNAPAGFRIVWKERAAETLPPLPLAPPTPPTEPVLDLTELAAPPPMKLRMREDRRSSAQGKPPAYLGGIDRRRGRDRRRAFGKRPVIALE